MTVSRSFLPTLEIGNSWYSDPVLHIVVFSQYYIRTPIAQRNLNSSEFSSQTSLIQKGEILIITMPARKASNKLARNSAGIRKSTSPKTSPKRTSVSLRLHGALQADNNNNPGYTTDHPNDAISHWIPNSAPSPPVTPVEADATSVFPPEIITSVKYHVRLPGWGVNGWKLFTTKHILRVVEVRSKAEAEAARLAARLESERSCRGSPPAKPRVATPRPVSLRIPGCRLNHRAPAAAMI
ncbi:hypothetical protein V496_06897 [Pseudogymnoascus sp. VKM F-4515 (FW-2607)]|nr:hypothetical protein V496_06897 [Pseudogymnoascus sp. VKM F-4515 (FW-2607)]